MFVRGLRVGCWAKDFVDSLELDDAENDFDVVCGWFRGNHGKQWAKRWDTNKKINFGWIKKKSMKMFNDFRFSKHSFDSFMMDLGIMGDLSRFEPHGLDGWTRPIGHPGFATFHIMCVAKCGWGEGRGAGYLGRGFAETIE